MRGRSKRRQATDARPGQPSAPVRQERVSLQLISDKLKRLTWRRRLWGVDERQVWHVVERLDEMYRELYREQEIRYEALLERAQCGAAPAPATASAPGPRQGQGAQTPSTPSVPDPRPGATAELSTVPRATAYQPLQAVPASPVPSRYQGQTVPRQASVAPSVPAGSQQPRPQAPQPVAPAPTPGSPRFRTS